MKRRLFTLQVILLGLLILAFLAAIIQVVNIVDPVAKQMNELPKSGRNEEFDPALSRLNSTERIINYCDSLYDQQYKNSDVDDFQKYYTEILSSVIRKRFYHGYSYYGLRTNYMAFLFSKVFANGYRAIIVPDDILKYPAAACSQQSIIMMEVLRKKILLPEK
ncbi:MAG: hypothetical protein IPF69_14045 [Chitinophagaceae bacterium]|nr:hypothetical protein [Chitinophagaceae bacterium]